MVSFRGILLSVLSRQQLKINNYNLLITFLTFSTLVLNDPPFNGSLFILNANFTKKKIYFSDFYYANKKYVGFSSLLSPDLKKHKHDWDAEEETMFKSRSEEPSQYRSQSYNTQHFPKVPVILFPGFQGKLWFVHEHSTKYMWQISKYNGCKWVRTYNFQLSTFIKIWSY